MAGSTREATSTRFCKFADSLLGLRKLCEHGQLGEAFQAVKLLDQQGISIPTNIFYCLLQRCVNKEHLSAGRALHSLIMRHQSESDAFLGSHLVRMFASCGSLMEANRVFSGLSQPNVFAWSAIISAHVKFGHNKLAIQMYHQMLQSSLKPDGHVFVAVIKACASAGALSHGRLIHENIINSGLKPDIVVDNALIDMYTKCGRLEEAHKLFDRLQICNVVTWNALIAGYVQHEHWQEALRLFQRMSAEGIEPNNITFTSILKACSRAALLSEGKLVHFYLIKSACESDAFVGSILIDMYVKCGSVQDARKVFNRLPTQTVVTWTVMIGGYAQHGPCQEAFQLFQRMQQEGVQPNKITFVSILKACSSTEHEGQVRLIQRETLERGIDSDVVLGSALIDVYAKCGSVEDAHSVFERLPNRNVVTWSTMIAGYAHGHGQKALELFQRMQHMGVSPDAATFVSILKACSILESLDQGKLINTYIIESGFDLNVFVANTLIDMYVKCGSINDAHRVFKKLPKRDAVIWSAMIAGYAQHGDGEEAMRLSNEMGEEDLEPDTITFVGMLKACSNSRSLAQGKLIHADILQRNLDSEIYVGNSLIDMYTKCGSMEDAQQVFERLQRRDCVTWSAMIGGYAQHSNYESALKYLEDMQQEGWKPDDVTFVSLLSACSHLGLVVEGHRHLNWMTAQNIPPTPDHYNCMVDLLGRSGHLKEAEDLLWSMPFECDIVTWTSLLAHCKTHRNVGIGEQCFDHVIAMDRRKAAGYVLMSDIYVHVGMQGDADKVEELRMSANAWKKPGQAFVELGNDLQNFIVSDKSHFQTQDIDAKLEALGLQMKEEGYAPHSGLMLQYMTDGKTEDPLCEEFDHDCCSC